MKAKTIHCTEIASIKDALSECIQNEFKPTLAFVFASINRDRNALRELFKHYQIDIVGFTSCGEFSGGQQSFGEISILLMDIDRTYYKIVFEDLKNCSFKDGVTALTSKTKESFPNANLILGTSGFNAKGEYFDGESLVNYLKADLPEGFSFYGGMAGDDMTLAGSFVFTNDHDSNEAIMALVLNAEKVKLQGLAITGWEKLGIARTITKSEGNLVYAIDHQPAVEMYLTYLGRKDLVDDHNYHGMRDELGMYYPFIQDRTNGGTVLKTPMKIDHEKQALVLDLEMPAGTKFWFSVPPDFDIVDRILDKAKELKEKSIEKADALLIFTCLGRQNVLGPMVEAENEGLRDVWECPMAGFYTYGEYGPDLSKKPEFHSGACCWVTIKEVED